MNLCKLSFANMRRNKGLAAVHLSILAVALVLFLLVNNLAVALRDYVHTMQRLPKYRTEQVTYNPDFGTRQSFERTLAGIEHVERVRQTGMPIFGMIFNSTEPIAAGSLGEDYFLKLDAFDAADAVPVLAGRSPLRQGEAMIPKNFQPYYDAYMSVGKEKTAYLDGERFIGQTISFSYADQIGETHTDRVRVVGVYDAVQILEEPSVAYLRPDDLRRLDRIYFQDKTYRSPDYDVVVDAYQNLSAVEKALKAYGAVPTLKTSLGGFGDFAWMLGGAAWVFSAIALFICLLSIYYLISSLIAKRRPLFALFKALGFRDRKILQILLPEMLFVGLCGALVGNGIAYLILMPCWKPILSCFFSAYFLPLQIRTGYYLKTVCLSFGVGVLLPLCAVLANAPKLRNIDPAEVLKDA